MDKISCLFTSLPVCERFRPFGVCGDLLKSSSAGMSDGDCMEAELRPVREKKRHGTLISAECFTSYFPTLSLIWFFWPSVSRK